MFVRDIFATFSLSLSIPKSGQKTKRCQPKPGNELKQYSFLHLFSTLHPNTKVDFTADRMKEERINQKLHFFKATTGWGD